MSWNFLTTTILVLLSFHRLGPACNNSTEEHKGLGGNRHSRAATEKCLRFPSNLDVSINNAISPEISNLFAAYEERKHRVRQAHANGNFGQLSDSDLEAELGELNSHIAIAAPTGGESEFKTQKQRILLELAHRGYRERSFIGLHDATLIDIYAAIRPNAPNNSLYGISNAERERSILAVLDENAIRERQAGQPTPAARPGQDSSPESDHDFRTRLVVAFRDNKLNDLSPRDIYRALSILEPASMDASWRNQWADRRQIDDQIARLRTVLRGKFDRLSRLPPNSQIGLDGAAYVVEPPLPDNDPNSLITAPPALRSANILRHPSSPPTNTQLDLNAILQRPNTLVIMADPSTDNGTPDRRGAGAVFYDYLWDRYGITPQIARTTDDITTIVRNRSAQIAADARQSQNPPGSTRVNVVLVAHGTIDQNGQGFARLGSGSSTNSSLNATSAADIGNALPGTIDLCTVISCRAGANVQSTLASLRGADWISNLGANQVIAATNVVNQHSGGWYRDQNGQLAWQPLTLTADWFFATRQKGLGPSLWPATAEGFDTYSKLSLL